MFDKTSKTSSSRLDWLDRVKGIGILFVVLGHIYIEDGFFSRIIHALNVPLFFIASGYLFSFKQEWKRPFKEIAVKKFHSILRPYFVYSAFMMLWLFLRLFIFHYGSFYEIFHCLADIFCLEGISVLWFLSALFIGQMLFVLSLKVFFQNNKGFSAYRRSFIVSVILALIFSVCAYGICRYVGWAQLVSGGILHKLILKSSRIFGRGVMAAALMFIGTVVYLLENKDKETKDKENEDKENKDQEARTTTVKAVNKKAPFRTKILFLCILLPLSLTGLWYNGLCDFHYFSFGNFWLYLFNSFSGFVCIACISRFLHSDKFLGFLGKNSLIIMATHLIFLDLIHILTINLSIFFRINLSGKPEGELIVLMAAEILLINLRCLWKKKYHKS